jgi:hypothetical protein
MPTEIRLVDGETVRVTEDYREVYAKLLSANWQKPCEFIDHGIEQHQVTVNPAYVVFFRAD